ncbi:uncharacterized protein [Anomalospiza imberbis]|uniref:uncharacterized protein n=1 Tax=Anomalospiza imberbis TaxID=187417 RepID=UPI00358FFE93
MDLGKTEEKETTHIRQIYPQKELEAANNCGEHCCHHLRPLIKTEYNYLSDDDLEPHITTKHIPYTATELAKLKKEYGRLPHESETEYVFRVSLTGGDQIKLTEQEASGYWGHGVFLTTGDKRDTWSLTQREAFWAGGTSPLERGDRIAIISTPDQLLESVHKAACLQMIHEKKLIPGFESPMQLPVKPEIMTPLIRELPETTAITLQKTIMTLSPVERLDRFLATASKCSSPASSRKVWTWGEVAEDLINYCRKYGPVVLNGFLFGSKTIGKSTEFRAQKQHQHLLWLPLLPKRRPKRRKAAVSFLLFRGTMVNVPYCREMTVNFPLLWETRANIPRCGNTTGFRNRF